LLREHGISIAEAVQFAVKRMRPAGRTKTMRDVIEELIASKAQRFERGDLRERSFRDFRHRGEKFAAGFEARLVGEVSGEDVKAWLNGLSLNPRTNRNYLAVVGEVFRFATQKRYVPSSPLDDLTDVDRKELCGGGGDSTEPSILTPAEAERLLNAALGNPDLGLLGAVTLALFCGLRTEEIKRLEWDSVRMGDTPPVVTIGAKIAKKRRIRHVEIPAVALPWLALVPDRTGQVTRSAHVNDYPTWTRDNTVNPALLKKAGKPIAFPLSAMLETLKDGMSKKEWRAACGYTETTFGRKLDEALSAKKILNVSGAYYHATP